jgi:hypothetical protein
VCSVLARSRRHDASRASHEEPASDDASADARSRRAVRTSTHRVSRDASGGIIGPVRASLRLHTRTHGLGVLAVRRPYPFAAGTSARRPRRRPMRSRGSPYLVTSTPCATSNSRSRAPSATPHPVAARRRSSAVRSRERDEEHDDTPAFLAPHFVSLSSSADRIEPLVGAARHAGCPISPGPAARSRPSPTGTYGMVSTGGRVVGWRGRQFVWGTQAGVCMLLLGGGRCPAVGDRGTGGARPTTMLRARAMPSAALPAPPVRGVGC